MKQNFRIILTFFTALCCAFAGCDTTEEEPLRDPASNIVGLQSEGAFNIVTEVFDFAEADAQGWSKEGNITAVLTGVLDNSTPITLSLAVDNDLLLAYNQAEFGTNSHRYAQLLPEERHRGLLNHVLTFPAGEREARFNIEINMEGLSPDVKWMIPLRVDKTTAKELDLTKHTMLFSIELEDTREGEGDEDEKIIAVSALYQHFGQKITGRLGVLANANQFEMLPMVNTSLPEKEVLELSADQMLTFIGDRTIDENANREVEYNKWGMLLTVEDGGRVSISKWGNDPLFLNFRQIDSDPEYPNTLEILQEDGKTYRVFKLFYSWEDENRTGRLTVHWMKEELRIEVI